MKVEIITTVEIQIWYIQCLSTFPGYTCKLASTPVCYLECWSDLMRLVRGLYTEITYSASRIVCNLLFCITRWCPSLSKYVLGLDLLWLYIKSLVVQLHTEACASSWESNGIDMLGVQRVWKALLAKQSVTSSMSREPRWNHPHWAHICIVRSKLLLFAPDLSTAQCNTPMCCGAWVDLLK